jgi:NitT/TauT family transport system substrate-binding protein
MSSHTLRTAGAVTLVLAFALTGCAASPAPQPTSDGGLTTIAVSTSPSAGNASLYLPIDDGSYEAAGLDVVPEVLQSGAQAVPLLLNGQLQFAASDPISAIVAISQGTPITIVAPGNIVPTDPEADPNGAIVAADSGIASLADLDGATVAVNALNAFAQVSLKVAIDEAGGDSASVQWVEFPIPEMQESVARGTVTAAMTTEPFLTAANAPESGVTPVPGGGIAAAVGGLPQLVYIASTEYVQKNPDVVEAFAAAIDAAATELAGDEALIRQVAKTSTSFPPEVVDAMIVPGFGPLTMDQLDELQSIMVAYGIIDAPVENLADSVIIAG